MAPLLKMHRNYKGRYGVALFTYWSMHHNQAGKCAICRTAESQLPEKLYIDHDHQTGKVRALLCVFCNTKLGTLENSDWVSQARTYLSEFSKENCVGCL